MIEDSKLVERLVHANGNMYRKARAGRAGRASQASKEALKVGCKGCMYFVAMDDDSSTSDRHRQVQRTNLNPSSNMAQE